jgi:hypothetical protein
MRGASENVHSWCSMNQTPDPLRLGRILAARFHPYRAVEAGFGAGPGCVAGEVRTFDPPVPVPDALAWLERYCHVLLRAHVRLDDGRRLTFERCGAITLRADGAACRPGLLVPVRTESGR